MKTTDARLDEALDSIEANQGNRIAVEKFLEGLSPAQKDAMSSALSLGSKSDWSDLEKERRDAVRAVILLLLTVGKVPMNRYQELQRKYSSWGLTQLKAEIRSRSPLVAVGAGGLWNQGAGFTDPKRHDDKNFRYVVFGMMNAVAAKGTAYTTILQNPDILKTWMISTSIIDQNHRATYYPYGLILDVPAKNFLSASAKDQSFKNYASQSSGNMVIDNDRRQEVMNSANSFPIPKSPQDLLDATRGKNGGYGYNEIVVLGMAPGGSTISISGIFKKVDSKGDNYVRPGMGMQKAEKNPYVSSAIDDLLKKLATARGIPIVPITDTSGAGA